MNLLNQMWYTTYQLIIIVLIKLIQTLAIKCPRFWPLCSTGTSEWYNTNKSSIFLYSIFTVKSPKKINVI